YTPTPPRNDGPFDPYGQMSLTYVTQSSALIQIAKQAGHAFQGLTQGPLNVENGAYADTLFALDNSGMMYAIDGNPNDATYGQLVNVFHNPGATLPAPAAPTLTPSSGGILTAAKYYYEITALSPSGETTPSPEQSVTVGANGEVTVNWTAVAGASGYNIYRGTASGGETLVGAANAAATSFLDTGAASPPAINSAGVSPPVQNTPSYPGGNSTLPNVFYYYEVTALTASGETTVSNEQQVFVDGNVVTINWNAVPNTTGYKIYRGTSSGNETLVADVSAASNSFTDTGASQNPPAADTAVDATERQSKIQLAGLSGSTNTLGIAFSTLDYNLWHVTNTNADPNQGINVSADQSRNATSPNKPPASGDSFYFGLESYVKPNGAPVPQNVLPQSSQYYGTATYANGVSPYNTYDLPGGAYGALTTNTFSLSGYDTGEKPTLYFDYYLDAGGQYAVKNTAPQDFSSARVFVSPDGGKTWQLVATNDTQLAAPPAPAIDPTTQMPAYISTSEDTGSGDPRQQVQPLWDAVSSNTGWRQARIDLSAYAGDSTLELRFDFSTAGTTDNPESAGNYGAGPPDSAINSLAFDNSFGVFQGNGAQARGQNLDHGGWYVDNIIVGFAGQGEMVTGANQLAGAGNTAYFPVPVNPDPKAIKPITAGAYELQIRRGAEYGSNITDVKSDIGLYQSFSINDRYDSSYSLNTDFTATPTGGDVTGLDSGSVGFTFGTGNTDNPQLLPTVDGQGELTLSMTAQMTYDPQATSLSLPASFTVTIPQLTG
ncbi:MAG: hypothetical protein ACREHD_09750, partial [Pirellulales bacterium]